MEHTIGLRSGVGIPMRDGIITRAELWTLDQAARPTILVRTPYGRRTHFHQSPIDPVSAAAHGYNLLIQDVRGRGDSQGRFVPYAQERDDGVDTLEWIVAQAWSDGAVVMGGPSYVGATQWLAAAEGHPALRAIAPANSSPSFGASWTFRDGVREHEFLVSWIATALAPAERRRHDEIERLLDAAPEELDQLVAGAGRWFETDAGDPLWAELSVEPLAVAVPVLTITGWYDIFLRGALAAHAARDDRRDRLIVGPWGHDNYFSHLNGSANLGWAGSAEAIGLDELVFSFYEASLAGTAPPPSRVRAFELGSRRWSHDASWPVPGRGVTITLSGGELDVDLDDLPRIVGGHGLAVGSPHSGWGPQDCTPLAGRSDVAVLRADPLEAELAIAGDITVELDADAPGPDAQWVALLCREHEGRLELVTEGVARGADAASRIELGPRSELLPAGAALVVLIAGGSTPRWDRPAGGAGIRRIRGARLRFDIVREASG